MAAAKPTEAVKPPAAKASDPVKPVVAAAKPTEVVKPPAAKASDPVKPVVVAAKPTEAVKPPAAKASDPVKPVVAAAKPTEAVKPPAAKASGPVKPVVAAAKPTEAVKPPAAKASDPVKSEATKPSGTGKLTNDVETKNSAAASSEKSIHKVKLQEARGNISRFVKRKRQLMVFVVLPLLFALLYFGLLAKDRYVSESMVVVKRADDMNIGNLSLGGLLAGGNASTKEDALLLQQYIMSPDMMRRLDESLDFKTAFANSGWDVFQRLPKDSTFEDFWRYYQSRVTVVFDENNSVLKITTQGFTPEFAQQFNQVVLSESERFINELSHKINREEMLFANQEINRAYGQLQSAKETLLTFQNDNNLVDPQVQIEATSRLVAELQAKQAQLEAELTNYLSYLNDDTPQIKAARSAIESIQAQVEKERATLTSSEDEQLNQKMFEFEELKAKVAFEGDLYKLSLTALEKSRVEAARKAKSLATISQPYLAEDARYPRRLYMLLTVFLVSLLVYGLAKVTLSIIEDHKI